MYHILDYQYNLYVKTNLMDPDNLKSISFVLFGQLDPNIINKPPNKEYDV